MSKRGPSNLKKLCESIITEVTKLDIDGTYKANVFGALLTQRLLRQEFPVGEQEDVKPMKSNRPSSLTDRILILKKEGFFKQSKSSLEVYSAISKTYPCAKNRVEVALTRLGKRRELRRTDKTEDGKQIVAYAW